MFTEAGLAQIEDALAQARPEAYAGAQASAGIARPLPAAGRDLRYWDRPPGEGARISGDPGRHIGSMVRRLRDHPARRRPGADVSGSSAKTKADPAKGSISHVSPLAKSMFGKTRRRPSSRPAAGKPKSRRSAMGETAADEQATDQIRRKKVMMPDYPRPPFASRRAADAGKRPTRCSRGRIMARSLTKQLENDSFSVMGRASCPAIHVFCLDNGKNVGCPAQGHVLGPAKPEALSPFGLPSRARSTS